jgi:hypothetical protein
VRLAITPHNEYLLDLEYMNPQILQSCLGSADFDVDNNDNIGIGFFGNTFDTGSIYNPHLIRLVRTSSDYRDGGFYGLVYFDKNLNYTFPTSGVTAVGNFKFLHPFQSLDTLDVGDTVYDVFTTTGVVQAINYNNSQALFDFASNIIYMTTVPNNVNNSSSSSSSTAKNDGDISCDAASDVKNVKNDQLNNDDNIENKNKMCIEKNDYFFLLDPYKLENNPSFLNLYKTKSIGHILNTHLYNTANENPLYLNPNDADSTFDNSTTNNNRINIITTDINTNWSQNIKNDNGTFLIYKFFYNENEAYEYVAQCSNRGVCNSFEGSCECFLGYSGNACDEQSTISF